MSLPHPSVDQISLANVLAALGDQTRLAIVGYLLCNEGSAINCGRFLDLGSKTNISYHLAKLREAGITRTEIRGTSRLISLRRADLDSRFPGLLELDRRQRDQDTVQSQGGGGRRSRELLEPCPLPCAANRERSGHTRIGGSSFRGDHPKDLAQRHVRLWAPHFRGYIAENLPL